MVQMNSDGNKIKENKYKILRMSLLLGNGEDREETINNFEDAAREIDAMNDEVYLKNLDSKFYDTFKLEEEEKKLTALVDYIGGRVEQRLSLTNDFANITGYELTNLPIIKYQDRLDEYKDRLKYIKEYLDNTNRINKLNSEINDLENKLNDSYVKKTKSEEKNIKSEEELFTRFKNIVSNMELFNDITKETIDSKLNEVISVTSDSKKSLDIFNKSFNTLNQAGISGEERNEYLSYVNGAKEVYYFNKEQEYLLRIYSLLSTTESEYENIVAKRKTINDLVDERINLRKELKVTDSDVLNGLYDLLDRQYKDIAEEKINLDNIDNYIREVDSKKIEVSSLEQDNQKVEILSLLKEFCIIDTYEGEKELDNIEEVSLKEDIPNNLEEVSDSEEVLPNVELDGDVSTSLEDNNSVEMPVLSNEEEKLDIENAKDNQVISIEDALNMNIELATSKSNGVMKRVGEMLGVKIEKNDTAEKENTLEKKDENIVLEKKDDSLNFNNDIPNDIFDNNNYDADPETNDENVKADVVENPLFNSEIGNSTLDDVLANDSAVDNVDNDFWFSNEEAPLDLNSLPDLTDNNGVNNDLGMNDTPSLDFPKMDVNGLTNEEDK
ncbi:MAG: hypothetical protein IJI49_05895 [Bacilli bacterium]|nr:hypothetical protein [Bacilli bacterium]